MKKEIIIPTDLNEIPLKHYQEFMKVYNSGSDEFFISEKMVHIFCGIKMNEVVKIKSTDVFSIIASINEMFNQQPKFQQRFEMLGQEFGFIPDLENISLGEYVDLEKYILNIEDWHKAMAVMYRPIKEKDKDKYLIYDYNGSDEFADVMKLAPLGIVLGAQVFFWNLRNDLLKALVNYLARETKAMTSTQERNSASNGDGTTQSIHLQMEMLRDSIQLQEHPLKSALPFLHTSTN
jgi:hypothetical protein